MSVNIGDKFDGFQVMSVATRSALEDYKTLAKWFHESSNEDHKAAANELWQWFCKADNKGTLAFGYLTRVLH
jgi:hypothetical protein